MLDTDRGLTKTHNALKDSAEEDPRILAPRSARRGSFAWLTSRAGDWTDALVVAHYAYATRLVTNDTGQFERLRCLHERGGAYVQPVQLANLDMALA